MKNADELARHVKTFPPLVKPMAQGAGLVDLSLWDTDAAALVEQVKQAAVGTGFLQVYNHGISDAVIDAAFAASRSFFALPDEEKAKTPFVGWAGGWEKEKQARRGGVTNTTSAWPCCSHALPRTHRSARRRAQPTSRRASRLVTQLKRKRRGRHRLRCRASRTRVSCSCTRRPGSAPSSCAALHEH